MPTSRYAATSHKLPLRAQQSPPKAGARLLTRAGFTGDVGCAVSTVIAILGALGKECSEARRFLCLSP